MVQVCVGQRADFFDKSGITFYAGMHSSLHQACRNGHMHVINELFAAYINLTIITPYVGQAGFRKGCRILDQIQTI